MLQELSTMISSPLSKMQNQFDLGRFFIQVSPSVCVLEQRKQMSNMQHSVTPGSRLGIWDLTWQTVLFWQIIALNIEQSSMYLKNIHRNSNSEY